MANLTTKIRNFIMSFSYHEKRNRDYTAFCQELQNLRRMSNDELKFEYIQLKTRCEHEKGVLTLFIISIALAVLMDVWNKFFSFMKMAFQYASSSGYDSVVVIKTSLCVSLIVAGALTFIILYLLFSKVKDISKLKKKLAIVEEVINERKTSAGHH